MKAAERTNAAWHELQIVPLAPRAETKDLYIRTDAAVFPGGEPGAHSLTLPAGAGLGLDTFFGAFYEAYWRRYASLGRVALSFRLTGKVRLGFYRRLPGDGAESLLQELDLSGDGSRVRALLPESPLPREGEGSVFARFTALQEEAALADMRWETAAPPCRDARLAVVVCAFNRDRHLAAMLPGLDALRREGLIHNVIVVNNGEPGLEKRLRALLPREAQNMPLLLREQENCGGSGGFTRGLMEARADGNATHALLLDDDIAADPVILRRVPVLLRYIKDNAAIGGFMLDCLKPMWLHNTVTQLRPELLKSVPAVANGDLGLSRNLAPFSKAVTNDSGGWWCFALPLAALGKTNLPLPFFLHYDDAEFGLRLKREGIESVVWPGVAVWHEPFYRKASGWRRYYDLRNMLFLLRYHGRLKALTATRQIWARMAMNLMQFHYGSAWATVRALEDFLAGPSALAAWDAESHRALMAGAKEWEEPDISLDVPLPLASRLGKEPRLAGFWALKAAWRLFKDFARPVNANAVPRFVRAARWHIWVAEGHDALAVPDEEAGVYRVYRRNRKKAWRLLRRFLRAYASFLCGAHRRWSPAELNALTTPSFWQGRFG